jgi:hypothetical protein
MEQSRPMAEKFGWARAGASGKIRHCAPRKFLTKARKVEPGAPARIAAKEKAERLESAMVSQAVQANLELSGGRKSGTGVTL